MPSQAVAPVVGATVTVKVDGAETDGTLNHLMQEFVFEDSVHVPDMIELRYADPNRAFPEGTPFDIGKELVVKLNAPGAEPTEFKAEITALSARYVGGVYTMTVRGLDKMHRLHRGRWTKTYVDVKASDVFSQIVGQQGLSAGTVDATDVTFPFITIMNESHFSFLRRLAADNARVLSFSDGKVHFKKRKAPLTPIQLSPAASLQDLEVVVTTADMTSDVKVLGWDTKQKRSAEKEGPVKATSIKLTNGTVAAIAGKYQASKSATVLASPVFADTAHATAIAEGAAEVIGGGFAEIHGRATGEPGIRAGTSIELVDVPKAFLGQFVVSGTRHVLNPHDGYTTEFTVSSDQDRSLLGMSAGGRRDAGPSGVVPGIVTNIEDPEKLGRVKVAFPWLDPAHESAWARTMIVGGGKDRGITFIPSVDDEVLVGFLDGDASHPIVLGGLYNGKDNFPDGDPKVASGQPRQRGLYTDKQGIVFVDKSGSESIQLGTRDKAYIVTIDKGQTTIKVHSDGKVEIDSKQDVTIKSQANVILSSTQKFSIEAQGAVSIKGMGVEIVDQAGASLKLQGTAAIKGATVAIN
jgi:uncharacterized protein involved in type VI secretion and phage assembly